MTSATAQDSGSHLSALIQMLRAPLSSEAVAILVSDDAIVVTPDTMTVRASKRNAIFNLMHREALVALGWTDSDIEALCVDWPNADTVDMSRIATVAKGVSRFGANPTQTRAWVKAIHTTPAFRTSPMVVAQQGDGIPEGQQRAYDLVSRYVTAADGDQDLACLACAAGISAGELQTMRDNEAVNRTALEALAGLRGVQR